MEDELKWAVLGAPFKLHQGKDRGISNKGS